VAVVVVVVEEDVIIVGVHPYRYQNEQLIMI
jgi:hypothetical protein